MLAVESEGRRCHGRLRPQCPDCGSELWRWDDDLVCPDCTVIVPVRPPEAPTRAGPGSPAKVAVLAERYAGGEALWHPGDNPVPDPLLFTPTGRPPIARSLPPESLDYLRTAAAEGRTCRAVAEHLGCGVTWASQQLRRLRRQMGLPPLRRGRRAG
jgi:hypothetical protein